MKDSSGFQPHLRRNFATTRWSLVISAGEQDSDSRNALEELCSAYWYPLYRFARTKGFSADHAADLTQEFFAKLIERNDFESVRQEKGRFRNFLLAAMQNFISNARDRENAQKRGGHLKIFSFDAADAEKKHSLEATSEETPELAFEKSWALTLLTTVQEKLKDEFKDAGRLELFEQIQCFLGGSFHDTPTYAEIANRLDITESAVKVNVHRMRKQFRQLLRTEISNTISDETDIDQELEEMFRVLSR